MPKHNEVPIGKGNIVKEFKVGNTVCRICDDYCRDKTPGEVDAILGRIAANAYRALYAAEVAEQR